MSATDHGPSNHDDELSRALRDLVDDASLPGLDAHLDVVRGRTRRRRAAKKVALGATTLCVAGALGVAAITLPQDVRPEPIAPAESPSLSANPTETPAPAPTFPTGIDAAALACQQPAPTPTGDDLPAHLSVGVPDLAVETSGSVAAPVLLRFDGDARLRYADSATGAYVVAQDGVIVSSSLPTVETTGVATPAPGSSSSWDLDVASSASCGTVGKQPSPLPAGDYEVFALHRLPLTGYSALQPDGTWGEETTGPLFDGWLVSEPVPLTISPEPDPVEVRDVLLTDTSAVFEELRQAAASGTPAALDLTVDTEVIPVVEGAGGSRTLTVRPNAAVSGRQRTTSDDGWTLALHGGASFADRSANGLALSRLVGTYDVTVDDTGTTPTVTLQVVDGGTPDKAPTSTDGAVCAAYADAMNGVDTSGGALATYDDDLAALAADAAPAADSVLYREIRSRWIESPRIWWSIVHGVETMRTMDVGGDALAQACEG
ncbi:hypothetical protein [Oerskovia enterophila]|uniref:Uncharacterized protein n=1 Tax=Oerskovia enterophila TaxID=43678 RepID=A0ABX2XZ37_9CELL|nr:hypothetical protein [Oerskovia enterophila]OCI29562.1 hypothetical protein OERS_37510 [Oerskovia enterophila]